MMMARPLRFWAPGLFLAACFWVSAALATPVTVVIPVNHDDKPSQNKRFLTQYVESLFNAADIPVALKRDGWNRGFELIDKHPNTALFPVTRTPSRDGAYRWVGPISRAKWGLYGYEDGLEPITTLYEASTRGPIGGAQGSARLEHLQAVGTLNIITAPTHDILYGMLKNGRIQYWAASGVSLLNVLDRAGDHRAGLKRLLVYRTCYLYLALSKGTDPDIAHRLQQAVDDSKRDGGFIALRKQIMPDKSVDTPFIRAITDLGNNDMGCVDP